MSLTRNWAVCLGACALLAGCATTRIDAQWADPGLSGHPLKGARVLLVCEVAVVSVQRNCLDQFSARLRTLGALPVVAANPPAPATDRSSPAAPYLPLARAETAQALWLVTLAPDASFVSQAPSFSFGIGGFGGGNVGGGIGVSMPVGASQVQTGLGAEATVLEVSQGKLLWSARAVAPPSANITAQLSDLAGALGGAAQQAGLF